MDFSPQASFSRMKTEAKLLLLGYSASIIVLDFADAV
jgi:hypothetical protein